MAPFLCFGTPAWPSWRHVKTLYRFEVLSTIKKKKQKSKVSHANTNSHGVANTSRKHTNISPGQLVAMDSCFGLAGSHPQLGEQFCCSQCNPAYRISCMWSCHLKGYLKAPASYVSYAMLMRSSKTETAVHGCKLTGWNGCAHAWCVDQWPHRIGVSVCHFAFFICRSQKNHLKTPYILFLSTYIWWSQSNLQIFLG